MTTGKIDTTIHSKQRKFGQHAFCMTVDASEVEAIAQNLQLADIDV